ncbi:MAG: class I SAM-dependent methyltransferase [Rhodovarius sp.]|nr:class I SAM-dependent methyltransferase [Rhodovarius sp.]
MTAPDPSRPLCPACGGADHRILQRVPGPLLRALWRAEFGVDPGPMPTPTHYACSCGVTFFSPARAGDAAFYEALYRGFTVRGWMSRPATDRADFLAALPHIRPGDAVLDVGGHNGAFGTLLRDARYTAIDPHADRYASAGVLPETAAEHAARRPEHYDVVTAFQVIEHVEEPRQLAQEMLACLKPGGLLILAGPTWPSTMTEIPNMVINAPPHHLTWWSPAGFRRFAESLGLSVIEAREVEGGPALREGYYWLHRLMPKASPETAFRHSWPLHLRLALAALLRRPLNALVGTGSGRVVLDALLVARKPGP